MGKPEQAEFRIGIDLGGTKTEAILLSSGGALISRERVATRKGDYSATIETIHDLVSRADQRAGYRCPVGIGIPGSISPGTGLIRNSNSLWLIGRPLKRDLESALDRPVRMQNDANCFAVSEAVDGAGRDAGTVFGVILGTGVGAGIAIRREAFSGRNGIAGEWGHNPLPAPAEDEHPGPACYCGRSGCIETFLSGPALERQYRAATGAALSGHEIAGRAEHGDSTADAVLRRYEERLARALGHVINILDPDVIVLGGGLSNIARLYRTVPRLWEPYIFSDNVHTELRPPVHGDSSGVRGAAWLWPLSEPMPEITER